VLRYSFGQVKLLIYVFLKKQQGYLSSENRQYFAEKIKSDEKTWLHRTISVSAPRVGQKGAPRFHHFQELHKKWALRSFADIQTTDCRIVDIKL
jgi:hypothetical protein